MKAADLADVSIGEWLGRVIHTAGVVEIKENRAVGKTIEQMAADMTATLAAFTESQAQQKVEQEAYTAGLQKLTDRLDSLEQQRRLGFFEWLFSGRGGKGKEPADASPPAPHS